MNLKRILQPAYGYEAKKYLRIMKLTWFLILALTLQTNANLWSQTTKMDVDLKNTTLLELFTQIENNSQYRFFYSNDEIDVNSKVTVRASDEVIGDILTEAFEDLPYSFKELKNDMILVEAKEKSVRINQQQNSISGKVIDEQGEPLPGVTVIIRGTTNGTVTNMDGNYSLSNIPEGATLKFSFVGMKAQEVEVSNQTTIDITLLTDAIGLEEVVAIGYGTAKKSDLTGSVSSLKAQEMEDRQYTSMAQTLQGRVAGVQVVESSGEPGGGVSIKIRGTNTFSGDVDPLYVIDGIPLSLGGEADAEAFSTSSNPLASLNPNDIERIEVLKDASATAIYGSRATNGVIVITTKKAKTGKLSVNFNSSVSIQQVINQMQLMNGEQYAEARNQETMLQYPTQTEQELIDQEILPFRGQGPYTPYPETAGVGTDFIDAVLQEAIIQNYQLSITGGAKNFSQLLSINYDDQEGVIVGSDFKRANIKYNGRYVFNEKLTASFSSSLNYIDNNRAKTSTKTVTQGVLNRAMQANPNVPLTTGAGEYLVEDQDGNFMSNPYLEATLNEDNTLNKDVLLSANIQYKVVPGLLLNARIGKTMRDSKRNVFHPYNTVRGNSTHAEYVGTTLNHEHLATEFFVNYSKKIDKHNITADVGIAYEDFTTKRGYQNISDFTFDNLGFDALHLGQSRNLTSSQKVNNTLQSGFARLNYVFNNKYYLTATGRADGSSKFGENNKWGFFPSGAFSWRISEESFMENLSNTLSNLKLRTSYGATGSQAVAPYQTLSLYSISQVPMADGLMYSYTYPNNIGNDNLKWATTVTMNLGLDVGLFDNKLSFSVDAYQKNTVDLLINREIPQSTGYSTAAMNLGELENKGIEFELVYSAIKKRNFSWDTRFNISGNKTKAISLGGNEYIDSPNLSANHLSFSGTRTMEGEEPGLFYGWVVDGLIQVDDFVDYANGDFTIRTDEDGNPAFAPDGADAYPGRLKYVDLNEDGIINEDDRDFIGNPNPDFIFGWNNEFTIGKFDVSMFFQGSYGNDILNLTKLVTGIGYNRYNSTEDWYYGRWNIENQHNNMNLPSGIETIRPSSIAIEDGSYLRLKNLIVRYNLQTKFLGVKKAVLFASATNLFTLTNYSGSDPEVSAYGNSILEAGIDYNSYPKSRTFTLGVNLSF